MMRRNMVLLTASGECDYSGNSICNRNCFICSRMAVSQFNVSFGEGFTHDQDGGNSNEFCIFELHTRRNSVAVVNQYFKTLCFKFGRNLFSGNGDVVTILARDHYMHIGRRNGSWPFQSDVVVEYFGN